MLNIPTDHTGDSLPTLYDADAVAKALGVTVWTVKGLARVGKLKPTIISRKLRFSAVAVRAYLEQAERDSAQ